MGRKAFLGPYDIRGTLHMPFYLIFSPRESLGQDLGMINTIIIFMLATIVVLIS